MPRFLNTWTGEFVWKNDAETVYYAILSHTWRDPVDGGEQAYVDILKIQAEVAKSLPHASASGSQSMPTLESKNAPAAGLQPSSNSGTVRVPSPFFSHPKLSSKIAMACKVSREAGYELLWIDACCIDKSSSAELTEAINSMYEWYRLSDVCYAYLADVPEHDDPTMDNPWFWKSRWHKRGWTLQELIAPERVVFLTSTWRLLGTKWTFATAIEENTEVDFDILVGRASVDSASVARRMSWATKRETTRVEDGAYSLLGIFGVHMAPIYGEGDNAFLRLQEEILKTVPDQTILVWQRDQELWPSLLAPSVRCFGEYANVCVTSPVDFASRLQLRIEDVPSLHAVVTPQGVRINLLCVDLEKFSDLAESIPGLESSLSSDWRYTCHNCRSQPRAHLLALLQCHDAENRLLALPLRRPPPGADRRGLYVAGQADCTHAARYRYLRRAFSISNAIMGQVLAHGSPAAVEVSILHHHSRASASKSQRHMEVPGDIGKFQTKIADGAVNFEFNSQSIQELGILGFSLTPLQCSLSCKTTVVSFTLSSNMSVYRPRTNDSPYREKIEASLSFTPLTTYALEIGFTAVNLTFRPRSHSSDYANFPGSYSDTLLDDPTPYILDTASGQYLREGRSSAKLFLSHPTHVLAHAEFAVSAGPCSPDEVKNDTLRIRWLKISVQRSLERPDEYLCITVELSGVHVQAKSRISSEAHLAHLRSPYPLAADTHTDAADHEYKSAQQFCSAYPPELPRLLPSEATDRIHAAGCRAWQIEPPRTLRFKGRIYEAGRGQRRGGGAEVVRVVTDTACQTVCLMSDLPILAGLYDVHGKLGVYYEVKVLRMDGLIAVGTACRPYPAWRLPGWNRLSAGLHLNDLRKFFEDPDGGRDYPPLLTRVGPGDTVGLGYSFALGTVFFTHNGVRLPDAFTGLYLPRAAHDVYAAVGVKGACVFQVNFGGDVFRWKEGNEWAWRVEGHVGIL